MLQIVGDKLFLDGVEVTAVHVEWIDGVAKWAAG